MFLQSSCSIMMFVLLFFYAVIYSLLSGIYIVDL